MKYLTLVTIILPFNAVAQSPPPCESIGGELFYTCLPLAFYIPNPGHCSYPLGDSTPVLPGVIVLCGAKILEKR